MIAVVDINIASIYTGIVIQLCKCAHCCSAEVEELDLTRSEGLSNESLLPVTLPSNRHHRSGGDCLEGKGENYQVCSVRYCVQQLCTVQCTHI